MNVEQVRYLTEIGTTNVARERAHLLWAQIQTIAPADLKAIFLCDYFIEDGVRAYGSLWLFTDKYISECRNFIENTHFDLVGLNEDPRWIDINAVNYDFNQASDASSIRAEGRLGQITSYKLTAVRNNCDHLKKIISEYFRP